MRSCIASESFSTPRWPVTKTCHSGKRINKGHKNESSYLLHSVHIQLRYRPRVSQTKHKQEKLSLFVLDTECISMEHAVATSDSEGEGEQVLPDLELLRLRDEDQEDAAVDSTRTGRRLPQ